MYQHVTPRAIKAIAARLDRLPFGRHPAMRFIPGQEGYRWFAFGGRAGPSLGIEHLLHDLAHAAEFGPELFAKRARIDGMNFKVRQIKVMGDYYTDPRTWQCTAREVRTAGMQLHLMDACGLKLSRESFLDSFSRSMSYMPDWYKVPGMLLEEEVDDSKEDGRFDFLKGEVLKAYRQTTQVEVLSRAQACLDWTQARLKRLSWRDLEEMASVDVWTVGQDGQPIRVGDAQDEPCDEAEVSRDRMRA